MLELSDDGLSAVPMLAGEMLGEMPSSETMLLKQCHADKSFSERKRGGLLAAAGKQWIGGGKGGQY